MLTKFTDASTFMEWLPIFRYAETLLNLAECYAQTGQTSLAQDCLAAVRRRAIADEADSLNISGLTGEALLTAIENEKRLEFIGEGMRGIELLRKGQTIEKPSIDLIVTPDDNHYTWPYPETETTVNTAIN